MNDWAVRVVWVILALSTLYLVVQNDSVILAALVAWAGGIMTMTLLRGMNLKGRHS